MRVVGANMPNILSLLSNVGVLVWFLGRCLDMAISGQVAGGIHPQEFEDLNHLNSGASNASQAMYTSS